MQYNDIRFYEIRLAQNESRNNCLEQIISSQKIS